MLHTHGIAGLVHIDNVLHRILVPGHYAGRLFTFALDILGQGQVQPLIDLGCSTVAVDSSMAHKWDLAPMPLLAAHNLVLADDS